MRNNIFQSLCQLVIRMVKEKSLKILSIPEFMAISMLNRLNTGIHFLIISYFLSEKTNDLI